MAGGKAIGRFEATLGVVGVAALVVTYSVITGWNPLPGVQSTVQDWLNRVRTLSEPAPAWTIKVGDQPSNAALVRQSVVVAARGTVESRSLATGAQTWTKQVSWSAIAGTTDAGVVVVGHGGGGYDVINPDDGAVLWSDPAAIGVWTFSDMIIGITCPEALACMIEARVPGSGATRWNMPLTGGGRPLAGANKALSGLRPMNKIATVPQPAPPLLGFPVDDQVKVVSTADGRMLHAYRSTQTMRVSVAGNRVIETTVGLRDGTCRYSVSGRDPAGDRQVWQRDGYDLRTSSNLVCEQRNDPLGEDGLLAAVGPDDREVLLRASTGAVVYTAQPGESILDTDGKIAVIRTSAKNQVRAVNLATGAAAWSRAADRHATVAVVPGAVLIIDPGNNHLLALSPGGGTLVDAATGATVLGSAETGLVINIGRQVGLLTYRGGAG